MDKICHGVLFDMDGVVVDTERSVTDFWQDLATHYGRPPIGVPELEQHVYGRQAENTLQELFSQVPPGEYGVVLERLRGNQENLTYDGVSGAVKLVNALSEAGVPIALVTGAQSWKVSAVLGQLGLSDAFTAMVRAEDVPAGKPDPACYLLGAQRIGIPVTECLVFEDALSGIQSAVAAQATCVAIGPPRRCAQLLQAGAVAVVANFDDVAYSPVDGRLELGSGTGLTLATSR